MSKPIQPKKLIESYRFSPFLLGGVMRFVREHSLLRAPAAAALLPADFFNASLFARQFAFLKFFNFVEQHPASEEAVERLVACALALHLQARRTMPQHYASRGFVDVLTTVPSRANECFFDVGFTHAVRLHALGKLVLRAYGS